MKKLLHLKTVLLLCALIVGSGSAWADYNELFSITSGEVVSNSGYAAYTKTVDGRSFVITYGGNNKSVGTNSGNRSNCKLTNYSKYAVSPVTTSSTASAFACNTSISNVSKISYTYNGGSNPTNTNVYLLYSSDNLTFSKVELTSGTQGATISSGTAYEFDALTGYFALLFQATNSSGAWRIDDVEITFYEIKDERLDIATINSLSPINIDFDAEGSFSAIITPAEGKSSSDYTVSYSTTSENLLIDGASYMAGSTKEKTKVKVTVTPTAENLTSYKPVNKEFDVRIFDLEANDGSAAKPFTVAEARTFQQTPDVFYDSEQFYFVKGWVSQKGNISSGRISYYISDDGTTTDHMYVYRGKSKNDVDFVDNDDIALEDEVVVYGKLVTRTNDASLADGSYLYSKSRRDYAGFSFETAQLNTYPNNNPFTGSVLNNPNEVVVTYSSNNTSVASVNAETGAVNIGSSEGTATITATYAGSTTTPYKTTTATYRITVARTAAGISFPAESDITTHANNSEITEPVLNNPNNLVVAYSSNNTDVATVNAETGQVTTGNTEGTATITATYTQTDQYAGATASYTVTVEREDPDFAFSPTSVTITKGDDFSAPTFTDSKSLSGIVFTSSYEAVATVSDEGVISLGGNTGTAIITASFAQTDYYHAYSTTCTITVNPSGVAEEPAVPGVYNLITSTDDLADGGKYLIVCESKDVAMGGQYNNGTYRVAVDVDITNHSISNNGDASVVTLVKSGDNWKLKFSNNKYYTTTKAKEMTESDTGTEATIDFEGNNVLIEFGSYGKICYNLGSPRFVNYTSTGQEAVQLYKFEAGDPVNTIDIYVSEAGLATYASNFDLDYSTNPNLKAYIAKENNDVIDYVEVEKVPAGTGVLLRALDTAGKNYTVSTTTEETDDMTGNKFVRGNDAAVASGSNPYNYILNVVNNKIGFYRAAGKTVAKNRAYLSTTINAVASARIDIFFDDDTNGIEKVENTTSNNESDVVFNLAGQRVAQPSKGLYIVNGRKVIVK